MIGDWARTTKDIDVSATKLWSEETVSHLRGAASLDLGDWFEVKVGEPSEAAHVLASIEQNDLSPGETKTAPSP